MVNSAKCLISLILMLNLLTGCPSGSPGGESDIPCFSPTAWQAQVDDFEIKRVNGEPEGLLLRADLLDDSSDPVYFFYQQEGSFSLVDNNVWDNEVNEPESCILNNRGETSFDIIGLFNPNLEFQGEVIPVAGGTAVRLFSPNVSEFIVAISTDGSNLSLGGGAATGQLYYQVFSEIDGSALNEARRVGLDESSISGCISADDKFLILRQNLFDLNDEANICIAELP